MSIKKIGFAALGLMALVAPSGSHAYATHAEMVANYQTCEKNDESWHRRWGQYLVAYDYAEATQKCREQAFPGTTAEARAMGCWDKNQFIQAGFYCQEISTLE